MVERAKDFERTMASFCVQHRLVPPTCLKHLEQPCERGQSFGFWDWVTNCADFDELELAQAMASLLHLPATDLAASFLEWEAAREVPEEVAVGHQVVPVRSGPRTITLATANPFDRKAVLDVERATGKLVQIVVATPTAIRDALVRLYRIEQLLHAYLARIKTQPLSLFGSTPGREPAPDLELSSHLPSRSAVKLLECVFLEATAREVSAIHIEPDRHWVRVLFGLDGTLEEFLRLPKWLEGPLVNGCKILGAIETSATHVQRRGSFTLSLQGSRVFVSLRTARRASGEAVHLRLQYPAPAAPHLEACQIPSESVEKIRKVLAGQNGLVLVAHWGEADTPNLIGTLVGELRRQGRSVLFIDPPATSRSATTAGTGDVEPSEAEGAAQDGVRTPALVLGELTDAQMANFALAAAQSGFLVVASVVASTAEEAVRYSVELATSAEWLADSLPLVVAEVSLRQACRHCQEVYEPDRALLRRLHLPVVGQCYVRGRGCSRCQYTGFTGRIFIYDVLDRSSDRFQAITRQGSGQDSQQVTKHCKAQTLWDRAATSVLQGLTTIEELSRVRRQGCSDPSCPLCGCEDCEPQKSSARDRTLSSHGWDCVPSPNPFSFARPNCGCAPTPATAVAPAANPTPAGPPPKSAPAGARPPQFGALIVQDETELNRRIVRVLQQSGLPLTLQSVASGAEASEWVATMIPDLVILDVHMPGMSGLALYENLRSSLRTAFVPVLVLTVLQDEETRTRALLTGTDDLLTKPFSAGELVARVRRILQRTYGVDCQRKACELATSPQAELRLSA